MQYMLVEFALTVPSNGLNFQKMSFMGSAKIPLYLDLHLQRIY